MRKITMICLLLVTMHGVAQEEMETDRPDQTECSSVIEPGTVQVETGAIYTKNEHDRQERYNYPTTLIRIGFVKAMELRLIAGEWQRERCFDSSAAAGGFQPVKIGMKVKVCGEKGVRPQTVLIAHLGLPFGDKRSVRPNVVTPEFRFSMSHKLSPALSLGYNLGMEWDAETPYPSCIYTLTTGAELTEKLRAYVEIYGNTTYAAYPECLVDGGFTYLLRKNLQMDASAGYGLNQHSDTYFLSVGLSFRLPQ